MKQLGPDVYETSGTDVVALLRNREPWAIIPMPHAAMDELIEKALADYRPHADRPLHDPEDDCA